MNNNEEGRIQTHLWAFMNILTHNFLTSKNISPFFHCFVLRGQKTSKCFENFPCTSLGVKRIKLKAFKRKMMTTFNKEVTILTIEIV